MKLILKSSSSEETEAIAYSIGSQLKGGEVIELSSDLGGGKTTFTKGLAKAIGSSDMVASPTFTISRVYNGQQLNLCHFDFYRLNDAGIMSLELTEAISPMTIVVVEWAGLVEDVLPQDRLVVNIRFTGEDDRELELIYPKSLSYLVGSYVDNND